MDRSPGADRKISKLHDHIHRWIQMCKCCSCCILCPDATNPESHETDRQRLDICCRAHCHIRINQICNRNETISESKFLILTDSLSVAASIKTNKSTSRPKLLTELWRHINKIKYSEVSIAWVPSHVGLAGNDKADSLAKDGLKREEANSTEYLEGKEMNSLIRDEY